MRRINLISSSAALGAMIFVTAFLMATPADAQAARSRSSASSASSGASSGGSGGGSSARASSGSSSASRGSSGGGAAVTRSSGRRSSTGPRTPVSGVSTHRSHGYGRHDYGRYTGNRYYHPGYPYYGGYPYFYGGYPYSYGSYPYYSFGIGWWGGYYYSPYFALGYSYPARPYYRYYDESHDAARVYAEPVGAFDLDVKPKKTEVWVDGRFVGTVGRFDGFPDYLWLDKGEHQLVFFLEGYATVERQVETLAGVVAELRIDMERGASIPARQLAIRPEPEPAPTYKPRAPVAAPERRAESATPETPVAEPDGELDLRAAPGRLFLSVAPADASVYLDGRYLGTGKDLARLHAGLLIDSGDHRLEVVRPGYEERAVEFSVGAGEEERIEIGLESG